MCWRVCARQPTPLKTSEDRVERLDAGLGGLTDRLRARGAAWRLGAGIGEHEVACSACRSMPGGGPRSDRKESPSCAGKEGARPVERWGLPADGPQVQTLRPARGSCAGQQYPPGSPCRRLVFGMPHREAAASVLAGSRKAADASQDLRRSR